MAEQRVRWLRKGDYMSQITCAATKAKNLLGQLGPLVWALHARHHCVGDTAEVIAENPSRHVRVGPGIDDEVREQAVRDITSLIGRASGDKAMYVSAGLRDVINRSIVVYAVAGLEEFLDDAGRQVYTGQGGDESKWPVSFGGMVDRLRSKRVELHRCDHYPQAALLALYRHKIVHADAKVDEKLVCQVAGLEKATGRQLRFCLSDDGSSVVWVPCGGEKLCDVWTRKRISLAIDEVVLPLLRDTQAFVAEAARKMAE